MMSFLLLWLQTSNECSSEDDDCSEENSLEVYYTSVTINILLLW